MPMIKKWDTDYDFKHEYVDEKVSIKTKYTWYFYLEDDICVITKLRADKSVAETNQIAIRETDKHGIELWAKDRECWAPYNDYIQKSYSDYLADQELLI